MHGGPMRPPAQAAWTSQATVQSPAFFIDWTRRAGAWFEPHSPAFTMQEFVPHSRPRGKTHPFSAIDLSTDWKEGSLIKVKAVRIGAFAGTGVYSNEAYAIERCAGFIELTGHKAGLTHTALWIGFTLAAELPAPTFNLVSNEAVGTLTLPAHLFGAYLAIVNASPLHFRIGGDGSRNAIANDPSLLR